MDGSLGVVLKELRKKKKLTAKETADRLSSLGYEISEKTISGYETGIRMPNADVFMALCTIYDCKNILEMFSFIKADYSIPTDSEWKMVEKYRFISTNSPDGASVVDTVLDRECTTAKKLEENKKRIEELENNIATEKKIANYPSHVSEDIQDHLIVQAAHNDAEIDEEELENMKSDIEQLKKLKNKK